MTASLKTAGTWARATADPTSVTIPGSPADGDRMFLFAAWKDFGVTVTDPSGWTPIGTAFTDGAVATGNGVGSVRVHAWYRDWVTGDAAPSLDWSALPTEGHAVIQLWQKATNEVWAVPQSTTAPLSWTTTNTVTSATGGTVQISETSVVMCLVAFRDDSTLMTRPTSAISDTSTVTWNGNYNESPATHFNSTTGDDMSGDLGHRFVTTGGASAGATTLSVAGTLSAAETGAAKWVVQTTNPFFPITNRIQMLLAQ